MSKGREILRSLNIVTLNPAYWQQAYSLNQELYGAEQIEKLFDDAEELFAGDTKKYSYWSDKQERADTHKAYLIGKRPIQNDTAESLLKEFLDNVVDNGSQKTHQYQGWIDRAKKLLEQK